MALPECGVRHTLSVSQEPVLVAASVPSSDALNRWLPSGVKAHRVTVPR